MIMTFSAEIVYDSRYCFVADKALRLAFIIATTTVSAEILEDTRNYIVARKVVPSAFIDVVTTVSAGTPCSGL